eukprot:g14707.t1
MVTVEARNLALPSKPAQQATAQKGCTYWVYWGSLFATPIIWVFAMVGAASDAWDGVNSYNLADASDCHSSWGKTCDMLTTAQAFQYMAIILVTVVLVLVVVAACMAAPISQKLGLAAGIMLAVVSVCEMITFAMMAQAISDFNEYHDIEHGAAFGLAITAWILSMAAAIAVLVLRRGVACGQDGPFRHCCSKSNATVDVYMIGVAIYSE